MVTDQQISRWSLRKKHQRCARQELEHYAKYVQAQLTAAGLNFVDRRSFAQIQPTFPTTPVQLQYTRHELLAYRTVKSYKGIHSVRMWHSGSSDCWFVSPEQGSPLVVLRNKKYKHRQKQIFKQVFGDKHENRFKINLKQIEDLHNICPSRLHQKTRMSQCPY